MSEDEAGPMFVAWFSRLWLRVMSGSEDVRENDGVIDVFTDTDAAPAGRYYVFHIGKYDCLAERRMSFPTPTTEGEQ